ncbi:MAG: phosphoglycerate kinase [Acidobacteria bacterium]|nr:MAG: phosphoglycerate kinase [Acidobacteriota bacterium]
MTTSGATRVASSISYVNLGSSRLRTIESLDLADRTVLIRADLNVPLVNGEVADDFRIASSLPTIRAVLDQSYRVIVASHLGRPHGHDETLSLRPVASVLGSLGGFDTVLAPGVIGEAVERIISDTEHGTVVVLENTRFEPGETSNDPRVAQGLARLADVFVGDAFGTAHRAHASNVGVAILLPSAAGKLLIDEVAAFERLTVGADRPFVVVVGGAKVSDKLKVIERLLPKVDLMLVGGAMCFTFLRAAGYSIGASLVEESMIGSVAKLLESEFGDRIVLPLDIVAADSFSADAESEIVASSQIRSDSIGLDIGPMTIERFADVIVDAASVFWNGPMGVFEWEPFRAGTAAIARAVAESDGYTVVGGGDSVAAIRALGVWGDISHVSSGGGAGLAVLEGQTLPGIEVLRT